MGELSDNIRKKATAGVVQQFEAWLKENPSGDVNKYLRLNEVNPISKALLNTYWKKKQADRITDL